VKGAALRTLPLSLVEPGEGQPRRQFDGEKLEALADSIRQHGILQPLLVQAAEGGRYRIVAGERRWRAARMAGLEELPVQVIDLSAAGQLEVALVENLQREDLNPLEQSAGYRRLIEEFGLTQEEVAVRVGRSRPAVANSLRLQQLPEEIQQLVAEGALSEGHARTLVGLPPGRAIELAALAVEQGLTVRRLERLVAEEAAPAAPQKSPPAAHVAQLQQALSGRLGRRVRLSAGAKKGRLEIEFYDSADLESLLEQLGLQVEL